MLLVSMIDGLTVGSKMYQTGEVFEITPDNLAWKSLGLAEDITDEQIKMSFRGGTELFRRPREEQLKKAYGNGSVDLDMMNDEQKKIIREGVRAKAAEMRILSKKMEEEVGAEEEVEEEKVEPGQVLQEGSESVPTGKKK